MTGSTEDEDEDEPWTAGSGARRHGNAGSILLLEERKLDGVPLVVQEAWICEDLRFVLQVRPGSSI